MADAATEADGRGWRQALAALASVRILIVLGMGVVSGLPLLLTGSTLTYWLSTREVSIQEIGLFAIVGAPYTFKFLWAPIMDQVPLPFLTRRLGRRRGWLAVAVAGLVASIVGLSATDPQAAPWWVALAALCIAFFSASQDIVIDAYRIEILDPEQQGMGAAATQWGYRVGLLVAGAGAIALSDFIDWRFIFLGLAAVAALGMLLVLVIPEPPPPADWERRQEEPILAQLKRGAVEPFVEFLSRRGALVILAFVFFYKFGDAIGGWVATPFYREMGFTGVEIGSVTKVFGLLATLVGTVVGGLLVAKLGYFRALFFGGVFQAVTNLFFAWIALVGHDISLLFLAIGFDNFAGGVGSAAFVAYLSYLCNVSYTATQYALFSSFMAFGRTVLSTGSGWLAGELGWFAFFVSTTLLAVPGLLLLIWLARLQKETLGAK